MSLFKTFARITLAVFFIVAGVNHFLNPAVYLTMMPPYLPSPELLNYVSGAAEVAGGIGILVPQLRWLAGWGLIALLVAVFPANIHLAMNGWTAYDVPAWILWARLPFQAVFIAWVYWACHAREPKPLSK